jgi:4-amino-4-deoxy-L-arabinose transferase-like glycosyltransferase
MLELIHVAQTSLHLLAFFVGRILSAQRFLTFCVVIPQTRPWRTANRANERELHLSTPTNSTALPVSPAQRIAWAILIALTLYVCYFSHLDVIGFVGPDEPRYAWIARDMAESGDWVTPRLYGKPWFEKPPLLYWEGAVFFKLLGESHPETAARLPSALCALLATLALAWLAWRTYGEECARWLLLLLPTSVGMIGFSHAAATDMPFAGMLTITMVCAPVVLGLLPDTPDTPILPRTRWFALLLFGFFLGLAVLAKGPAGLILIGGAIFFWAFFSKRRRDALRLLHPAAIAAFCLTALPWYMLCARRNPDFFRIFIIEHNFKRYLTPEFQHIQPFWFYLPILLIAFMPWTIALLGAISFAVRQFQSKPQLAPTTWLLISWSAFCLLFFTISSSKLPGYILPAVPALALLLARFCSQKSQSTRYPAMVGLLLFGAGAVAVSIVAALTAHTSYSTSTLAYSLCIVLFLFALANGVLWGITSRHQAQNTAARVSLAAGLVAPVLIAMLAANRLSRFLEFSDPSGRPLAEDIIAAKIPAAELSVYNMKRSIHYGLNFYLKTEIKDWDPARPTVNYLLLGSRNCEQVVSNAVRCIDRPIYFEHSRQLLYRLAPQDSLPGSSSGRQPQ